MCYTAGASTELQGDGNSHTRVWLVREGGFGFFLVTDATRPVVPSAQRTDFEVRLRAGDLENY